MYSFDDKLLPGGLKGVFTGDTGQPGTVADWEGVVGLVIRVGREGGPIELLLVLVVDRFRAGDGAGETRDNVSTVRCDNDCRCRRRSLASPSNLSRGSDTYSLPTIDADKSVPKSGGVFSVSLSSVGGSNVVAFVGEVVWSKAIPCCL